MRLTEQQKRALGRARTRIGNEPRSYRQQCWGTGPADCNTPGCVAGHIVASDPERLDRVMKLDRSWLRREAVEREAHAALGLEDSPALFSAAWPKRWLRTAGVNAPGPGWRHPTAREAAAVLSAVLDGKILDALTADVPTG